MRAAQAVLGAVVLSLVVSLGFASTAIGAPEGNKSSASEARSDTPRTSGSADRRQAGHHRAKKKWVPPKGAAFSNPQSRQHRVLVAKVVRAVNASKKGSKVQIAVWNLDDWPSVNALLRAKKRGVTVQVVVAGSVQNPSFRRLARGLNHNKKDNNFARKCSGGCRSRVKIMHSKFYLFSKVHRAENISMFGSSNMTTPAGNRQWNDLVTSWNPKLYRYLQKTFVEYKHDKSLKHPYEVHKAGRYRVTLYPARGRNPQLHELKRVRCKGTKGGTGNGKHRTVIRMAVAGWFDSYGQKIANRVRHLWDNGCDIRIVTTLAGRGINRTLKNGHGRGPVPIRELTVDRNSDGIPEMYLHEKSLSISGRYGKDRSASVVFTGSPNWSTRAQRSEEIWIRVMDGRSMTRKYIRHVDRLYFSRAAHGRLSSPADLRAALAASPNGITALGKRSGAVEAPSWLELD